MSVSAAQLLKALGAGILPSAAKGAACECDGALDFASLLRQAQAGELTSGRTLQIDSAANVDLSADQLARLNQAADAAEVAGSKKLFAMIDGTGVVIDVPTRTIERTMNIESAPGERLLPADVMVGVDAIAVVPIGEGEAISIEPTDRNGLRSAAPFSLNRIENQSLLSRFAQAT